MPSFVFIGRCDFGAQHQGNVIIICRVQIEAEGVMVIAL